MNYPSLQGDHIIINYNVVTYAIAQMVLEHYDIPTYDNCVFEINTWTTRQELDSEYTNKRFIYYQMEHLGIWKDFRENTLKRILEYDEVWDMSLENITWYPKGASVKFMPLRYTRYFNDLEINHNKESYLFDFTIIGVLSDRRAKIVDFLSHKFEFNSGAFVWGKPINELKPILENSKVALNLHQYDGSVQEQVRIFELVSIGMPVVTEYSSFNYFPGLVINCKVEDLPMRIHLLHPESRKLNYCDMTYANEDYEKYKKQLIEDYQLLGK